MAQLFAPAANAWFRLGLVSLLIGGMVIVTGLLAFARSSYNTSQNYVPDQPIPFSHEHHVADCGIDCRYCHTSVTKEARAGMPSTETCLRCHRYLFADSEMLRPIHDSWRNQEPLRWNRVHDLPDFVYFNHSIHINKGIGCYSCHGRVDRMPLIEQAAPLTMQWCLDCHRNPEAHVRPKSLIFETRPLAELIAATPPQDSEDKYPQQELNLAEQASNDADVASSLQSVRHQLAEEYAVESYTDCYTCHR